MGTSAEIAQRDICIAMHKPLEDEVKQIKDTVFGDGGLCVRMTKLEGKWENFKWVITIGLIQLLGTIVTIVMIAKQLKL